MSPAEVHASLLREQAAAGVVVVPPSVEFDLGRLLNMGTTSCTTAASMILVGAMAGWLDTYGGYSDWMDYATRRDGTPLLDRLHAATLRVLRTLAEGRGKANGN